MFVHLGNDICDVMFVYFEEIDICDIMFVPLYEMTFVMSCLCTLGNDICDVMFLQFRK